MPSDDRLPIALEAVAPALKRFRSVLSTAQGVARTILAAGSGAGQSRAELGRFAEGRIDTERFAELSAGTALDTDTRGLIVYAAQVLEDTAGLPDDAFVIRAESGESLAGRVGSALTLFGRAFSAAHAIDRARHGRGVAAMHELSLAYPFAKWSAVERMVAPPLVVVVDGAQLSVAALGNYLDGGAHVCLVVEGTCPPAALARLITPGTMVVQTADTRGLDRFASYEGPAIAALVAANAAQFIHDPGRGRMPWQRIELWHRPDDAPRGRLGSATARQQREDLEQLLALATPPTLPDGSLAGPATADDIADRLSAWLLTESGLGGAR
jgi:hypothetical protein